MSVRTPLLLAALSLTAFLDAAASDQLAFYSNREGRDDVYLMDSDGSNVRRLTLGPHGGKCPDLSPDGRKVVFVSDRDGNPDVYLLDVATGVETCLTDLPGTERQPKWSPDGSRIALQSDRDGRCDLYTMSGDGSGWVRLTSDSAEELWPSWSPDGARIVFSSDRHGNHDIYTVAADGTDPQRVTDAPENEYHPVYSPDGRQFVYQRRPLQGRFQVDLYLMNVDGAGGLRLTDLDGVEENPVWSPDGQRIIFQTMKDGNFELYSMNADGSDWRNMTNHPANDYWPSPAHSSGVSRLSFPQTVPADQVQLHVVYENTGKVDGVRGDHGFGCYVVCGDSSLLFDAGANGDILLANVAGCGVDLSRIDHVVVSHLHSDHIGGLPAAMKAIGDKRADLHLPGSRLPGNLMGRASTATPARLDSARSLATTVNDGESAHLVSSCAAVTGTLGDRIPEQGMILNTSDGPVVIVGCAHPGIDLIARRACELTGRKIRFLVGGFHLVDLTAVQLDTLATQLSDLVEYIAPCHCSGDLCVERFKLKFGDRFITVGAGDVIRISELGK